MKLVTPEQMNEIDRLSINEFGIPGIVLMENAALAVVGEIEKMTGDVRHKKIIIFAGKGNNGGDAFAAARHLYNKGAAIKVYITADRQDAKGDALVNLNILKRTGVPVEELAESLLTMEIGSELRAADLLLDGIFGTGFKGEVKGVPGEAIRLINNSGRPVVSIDIPSGISGTGGVAAGACVKADRTVTFGLPKMGLVVHPGCDYAGELVVADIGIPERAVERLDVGAYLIDDDMVSKLIPARHNNTNKGDYGRVLIISGSTGMTGSGCLAARAALRTGAGLVYLGVPSTLVPIYESNLFESITIPLEDKGSGYISKDGTGQILSQMKGKNVIAVGPGLSVSNDISDMLSSVISNAEVPLVLDADALNVISRDISILGRLKTGAVLTPHPGEMARLAGISIDYVQNNRIETAKEFACRWRVTVVLKGSRTVVAAPDGTICINPVGNPGMATAGAGDVLTGIIAGLISQGVETVDAAVAGVYIHGFAGDRAAANKSEYSLIAGDIVEELPNIFKVFNRKSSSKLMKEGV